jgi:hypothetical protein
MGTTNFDDLSYNTLSPMPALPVGATLSVTASGYAGRTMLLDTAAGSVVTLPAATGSGTKFRFLVSVIATSNSHIIKVANASDTMTGMVLSVSDDAGFPVKGYTADANGGRRHDHAQPDHDRFDGQGRMDFGRGLCGQQVVRHGRDCGDWHRSDTPFPQRSNLNGQAPPLGGMYALRLQIPPQPASEGMDRFARLQAVFRSASS